MANSQEHFPSIGDIAERTDLSSGHSEDDTLLESSENSETPLEEITSLCMQCEEQGVTRFLLTSIPFFREIIVMSFRCDHCGASNNEVQSAGAIRPEGIIYTAKVLSRSDLDRQIVRSASCSIEIPEYELNLPPSRGQLTTVEGLLRDIVTDLSADQLLRRLQNELVYSKIQSILDGIQGIIDDVLPENNNVQPITIKLDDPAGNSFIEFVENMSDPKWSMRTYRRTPQQNMKLGLVSQEDVSSEQESPALENPDDEIYEFEGECSSCGHSLVTRMKKVVIPYFKDILIMSTNCEKCGYRDNEVKSGASISALGKKITLKVEDREDLSRDILKSETSGLSIPEIDLVLQAGTLGGRFTTLEGILDQIYEELSQKTVFATGDSVKDTDSGRIRYESFLTNLKLVKNAERPFTLVLDDPLANSYIQNLYAPDPDPNMDIVTYERTWQQDEELGLNDMKVEGYGESE